MSSESLVLSEVEWIETSLIKSKRFLDSARNDRALFRKLEVHEDDESRSAAMHMAIDEALLENAKLPSLRLYRWDHAALSFGYFGRYADVASQEPTRELVRRWTGGGIVLHGDDLTYSIIIPRSDPSFTHSPIWIYERIHTAIQRTLVAAGKEAELAAVAGVADAGTAASGRGYNNGQCFANPVPADVLVDGRKVAGAAQRRTRAGLLQQGSIQHVDLAEGFGQAFARQLAENCTASELNGTVTKRAAQIAEGKYSRQSWLKRR